MKLKKLDKLSRERIRLKKGKNMAKRESKPDLEIEDYCEYCDQAIRRGEIQHDVLNKSVRIINQVITAEGMAPCLKSRDGKHLTTHFT